MAENNVIDFAAAKVALKRAEATAARDKARGAIIETEWESGILFDEKGRVDKASGRNATLILTSHEAWLGAVVYDSFAEKIVIARDCPAGRAGEDWADVHDKLASDWLEGSKYGLRPSPTTVANSINAVARGREVHPVRDYLRALVWDGVPRVDHFATAYLGATCAPGDDARIAYLARVSAITLIGPVARVMRPGCMLKTVPILEGPQDLGKSTAVKVLCPRPEWFSDSEIPYGHKDAFQGLRGKWLIELAEIDKDLKGRICLAVAPRPLATS